MSLADPAAARPSLLMGTDRAFVAASRLAALALLATLLALASPSFLTFGNLANVMKQASLQFVMSAGLTAVVITGGIDLSIGAVIGLSACLGGSLLAGGSIFGGVFAALGVGLACGVFNGVMIAYVRIPSFIATYGMLWIAFGLGYVFMMGEVIYGFPPAFRFIATGSIGPVPMLVVMAALVLAAMHVILTRTPFGRALYAIGGNANAARLSGMPVQRRLVMCYALSGLVAGVAALLVIARTNAADAGLGEELLLPIIAAVAVGGTSLAGGTGGVVGTAIGATILTLIINGMNLLGVKTFWQAFAMGTLILISVATDEIIRRRRSHVA